jgi:hypothetical protein
MNPEHTTHAISELLQTLARSGHPCTAGQRAAIMRWAIERSLPTHSLLEALREPSPHPGSVASHAHQAFAAPRTEGFAQDPAPIAHSASADAPWPAPPSGLQPPEPQRAPAIAPAIAQSPSIAPQQPGRSGMMQQAAVLAAATAGGLIARDALYSAGNAVQEQLASLDKPDVLGAVDWNGDGAVDAALIDSNSNGVADLGDSHAIGNSAQAAAEADGSFLDALGELFS